MERRFLGKSLRSILAVPDTEPSFMSHALTATGFLVLTVLGCHRAPQQPVRLDLGATPIPFEVHETNRPGPAVLVLHADEQKAAQAGRGARAGRRRGPRPGAVGRRRGGGGGGSGPAGADWSRWWRRGAVTCPSRWTARPGASIPTASSPTAAPRRRPAPATAGGAPRA